MAWTDVVGAVGGLAGFASLGHAVWQSRFQAKVRLIGIGGSHDPRRHGMRVDVSVLRGAAAVEDIWFRRRDGKPMTMSWGSYADWLDQRLPPEWRGESRSHPLAIGMLGRDESLPHPLGPPNPSARWSYSIGLDEHLDEVSVEIEGVVRFSNDAEAVGRGWLLINPIDPA